MSPVAINEGALECAVYAGHLAVAQWIYANKEHELFKARTLLHGERGFESTLLACRNAVVFQWLLETGHYSLQGLHSVQLMIDGKLDILDLLATTPGYALQPISNSTYLPSLPSLAGSIGTTRTALIPCDPVAVRLLTVLALRYNSRDLVDWLSTHGLLNKTVSLHYAIESGANGR